MDFKNAQELLTLCEEKNLPISEIMRIREIELGETTAETVKEKMFSHPQAGSIHGWSDRW